MKQLPSPIRLLPGLLLMIMMVGRAADAAVPAELRQADGVTFGVRRPATGPAPHVAVIYENGAGSITHPMCTALAERGFLTLCAIQRNGEGAGAWESVALDVKALVQYARSQPGITRVVIYGHSGGGAVGSFYQAVAENGVAFCQDPKKFSACGKGLANLPPADGIAFVDAHPGLAVMALRNVNPSVSSNGRKLKVDPALDPLNPRNGFNPHGPSHYPAEFQAKYTRAQAVGMDQLIARAQSISRQLASGAIDDPIADQVENLAAGAANNLAALDPDIAGMMYTTQPRRMLRNDGTITTQLIRSSSVGSPELVHANSGSSIRSSAQVLSRGSVRARDSISDMDVCTSNANTSCNVRSIRVPVLFMPAGGYEFIADNERMFESSPSADKEFIVTEGALHSGAPCVPCEKTPGRYANSENNQYDYVRDWINRRF